MHFQTLVEKVGENFAQKICETMGKKYLMRPITECERWHRIFHDATRDVMAKYSEDDDEDDGSFQQPGLVTYPSLLALVSRYGKHRQEIRQQELTALSMMILVDLLLNN